MIRHTHYTKYLHAGSQFILSQVRTEFWPINGRNEIRSVLRKCITCFKIKPPEIAQVMGDLPEMRVTPSYPFAHCGIDYAGPFQIKDGKTRNRSRYINNNRLFVYLCLFDHKGGACRICNRSNNKFLFECLQTFYRSARVVQCEKLCRCRPISKKGLRAHAEHPR